MEEVMENTRERLEKLIERATDEQLYMLMKLAERIIR